MNYVYKVNAWCWALILIFNCVIHTQCESLEEEYSDYEDSCPDFQDEEFPASFLQKVKNGSEYIHYWLYTKDKPNGEELNPNTPNMLKGTSFNVKNPIKVLVHGFNGELIKKESLCENVMTAYLHVGEFNVICVKWSEWFITIDYRAERMKVRYVGYETAKLLNLITSNINTGLDNVHLIGHSLGAHIVGFCGKKLNGQIPRITGLDPAYPGFMIVFPCHRIDKTDAKFVDIIHSNAGRLGMNRILGHIDFFPNGGSHQPHCIYEDLITAEACSHLQSIHYYTQSILVKDTFKSIQCKSWKVFQANECGESAPTTCMGEYVDQKQSGTYYLNAKEIGV